MTVMFDVHGLPAPQGSKRAFVVKGRAVLVESSAKVRPWREDVKQAALTAMSDREPLEGPVAVRIYFRLPRPKSAAKAVAYPAKRPDIDKLTRSTLDALTTAGVFRDDAQVVQLAAFKDFGEPGALIHVRAIE